MEMQLLSEEFLRMQKLAGIPTNSDSRLINEGIKTFFNELGYNLLTEEKAEIIGFTNKLSPREKIWFKIFGAIKNKLGSEGIKLFVDAVKEIVKDGLTPDQIKAKLNATPIKEAEEEGKLEDKGTDAIGKLGAWLRKSKLGNVVRKSVATLVIGVMLAPMIANAVTSANDYWLKNSDKVEQTMTQDVKADGGANALNPNELKAEQDAQSVGVDVKDGTLTVPFKLAQGNAAGVEDQQIVKNFINDFKAKFGDGSTSGKIVVKVTGYASNSDSNSDEAEQSKTSPGTKLSQERAETIAKLIPKKIGNVEIEVKTDTKDTKSLKSEVGQKDPTKGAAATIDIEDKDLKKDKATDPLKLLPVFQPATDRNPDTRDQFDVSPKPKDEPGEASPEKTDGNKPTGTSKDQSTDPDLRLSAGGEETSGTEKAKRAKFTVKPDMAQKYLTAFPRLNRNGQLATILSIINPSLNIFSRLKQNKISNFTDSELTDPELDPIASDLGKLIINLRKNPETLINRISKATGVKFGTRAKAKQTAPGQKYTPSAQVKPVLESVNTLKELIEEELIDNMFRAFGVTDEFIKQNKVLLLALLGSMYAKEGNTSLSILDPKQLSSSEIDQLKKYGFTPQNAGKEYIFIKK